MTQINAKLLSGGHFRHWCPGCGEIHMIPSRWQFNNNFDSPTVSPSVRITGVQTIKNERGEWTGGWVHNADGRPVTYCCHYLLTDGQLHFLTDCTHTLAGQTVPLPPLPDWLQDGVRAGSTQPST